MATVRALECLLAIAETGSLRRAAEQLHLSQSALSHQVQVLEAELGSPVFHRLPRGVTLTAAGAAMLEPARSVVLGASRALAIGRAVSAGEGGVLRIACAESLTGGLLAAALATWRRETPDVAVELIERLSAEQMATDVLVGDADLAVGPMPAPVGLEVTPLRSEAVRVVVATTHPLAARDSVSLKDLVGVPFVHLDPANSLSGWIDAVTAAAGIALQPVVRVRTATAAASVASAGLGASLVPEFTPWAHDGASIPLDPPLSRDIFAMHKTMVQPLVSAFCEVLLR